MSGALTNAPTYQPSSTTSACTTKSVPSVHCVHTGCSFTVYSTPTIAEVTETVRSSPNKQCQTDPLPTWLLKDSIDTLAPFLISLLTKSVMSSKFPLSWNHTIVHQHLKRADANETDIRNYHPVFNPPFLLKVLERLANRQVVAYLVLFSKETKDPLI